ncbi:MAG TPA: RNA methyltransferase [Terracidiphilus sp.]|nr:RNA methyltransferase [Terracidiphilus sp.]
MPVRIVQSKQNARLRDLRRALASPGRKGEAAGIEGRNLIEEAVRAGLTIRCLFLAQESEPLLEELALPPEAGMETEILLVPKALLDAALTTETPQPVAALVEPHDWTWTHLLDGQNGGQGKAAPLILILAGLQDPGNLGTILRSAEAFGATGAVSLPGTVNAWNPKAVRASAGSVFRVPVIAASEKECFAKLREAHVQVWTTTSREAQPANLADLAKPVALLIGNEGNGVSSDLARQASGALTISCPGPVESLNAAVATSVLLYEAARQRATSKPVSVGGLAEHRGARR